LAMWLYLLCILQIVSAYDSNIVNTTWGTWSKSNSCVLTVSGSSYSKNVDSCQTVCVIVEGNVNDNPYPTSPKAESIYIWSASQFSIPQYVFTTAEVYVANIQSSGLWTFNNTQTVLIYNSLLNAAATFNTVPTIELYNVTVTAPVIFNSGKTINVTASTILAPLTASAATSLYISSSKVTGASVNTQGNLTLQSMAFTNCTQTVRCQQMLIVDGCTFQNCTNGNSSAIYTSGASTINNSTFQSVLGTYQNVIFFQGGPNIMTDVTLTPPPSSVNPQIYLNGASLTSDNCSYICNSWVNFKNMLGNISYRQDGIIQDTVVTSPLQCETFGCGMSQSTESTIANTTTSTYTTMSTSTAVPQSTFSPDNSTQSSISQGQANYVLSVYNNSVNASVIDDLVTSIFYNQSSPNPVSISNSVVSVTAYNIRRSEVNLSSVQVNVTGGARSSVSKSTFDVYNATIVVMSGYSIEYGVFSEKPQNISSDVYGLTLMDGTGKKIEVSNSPEAILIHIPLNKITSTTTMDTLSCLYWNETGGSWMTDGCTTHVNVTELSVTCSCTHLTNFTIGTVKSLASGTPQTSQTSTKPLPMWLIIAVAVGGAVLVSIVVVVSILVRRKIRSKHVSENITMMKTHQDNLVVEEEVIYVGQKSTIYNGTVSSTTQVAIKKSQKNAKSNEMSILQELRHPNIVQYFSSFYDDSDKLCMVLELMTSSLYDRLRDEARGPLYTTQKEAIVRQLAGAMSYLKENDIIHGDLCSQNVLIRNDDVAKICDFGSAIKSDEKCVQQNECSVRYRAPELFKKKSISFASDVWAFGVISWEVYMDGETPYADKKDKEVSTYVVQGGRLTPTGYDFIDDIMARCWNTAPTERMDICELASVLSPNIQLESEEWCKEDNRRDLYNAF